MTSYQHALYSQLSIEWYLTLLWLQAFKNNTVIILLLHVFRWSVAWSPVSLKTQALGHSVPHIEYFNTSKMNQLRLGWDLSTIISGISAPRDIIQIDSRKNTDSIYSNLNWITFAFADLNKLLEQDICDSFLLHQSFSLRDFCVSSPLFRDETLWFLTAVQLLFLLKEQRASNNPHQCQQLITS